MTICFMCRKPIPSESDEESHHQNRQAVEYAGEPIHRGCHPTNVPEADTDHVAVHEHLLQAQRELSVAVDECGDDTDASKIMDLQLSVKVFADDHEEKYI